MYNSDTTFSKILVSLKQTAKFLCLSQPELKPYIAVGYFSKIFLPETQMRLHGV